MRNISRIATALYHLICNDGAISEQEGEHCIRAILRSAGSGRRLNKLIDSKTIAGRLQQQARMPRLINRWRTAFLGETELSQERAHAFIRDVLNSVEDAGTWFTQNSHYILAGGNTREVDTYTDIVTYPRRNRMDWGIHLTCEGNGRYTSSNECTISKPGDLLLLSPSASTSIGRDESCKFWRYQYVHFPLSGDYLRYLQWPEVAQGMFLLSASVYPLRGKLQGLFEAALETVVSSEPLAKELLQNTLEEILIRCRQLALQCNIKPIDKRILSATTFIRDCAEQPITIQDISTEVGLSSSRLSTLFKQQIGASPLQWRDEQRMLKACHMLVDSQDSLSRIAEAVGYSDSHYFSRCFRQHMECTPSQYRKENRYSVDG
tara:strand:+ start:360 stop:1490 length:1131 start_codon:yes stop_codon:yes gene_type:complete